MKLPELSSDQANVAPFNVATLVTVSLVWGMMLGMISPWFSVLAVFTGILGYGSEVRKK